MISDADTEAMLVGASDAAVGMMCGLNGVVEQWSHEPDQALSMILVANYAAELALRVQHHLVRTEDEKMRNYDMIFKRLYPDLAVDAQDVDQAAAAAELIKRALVDGRIHNARARGPVLAGWDMLFAAKRRRSKLLRRVSASKAKEAKAVKLQEGVNEKASVPIG